MRVLRVDRGRGPDAAQKRSDCGTDGSGNSADTGERTIDFYLLADADRKA